MIQKQPLVFCTRLVWKYFPQNIVIILRGGLVIYKVKAHKIIHIGNLLLVITVPKITEWNQYKTKEINIEVNYE